MSTGPRSLSRLHRGPGLVDPGVRRSRLAFRPSRRRGDVADGDGDDPIRIEDRERILGNLLAEAGERLDLACALLARQRQQET